MSPPTLASRLHKRMIARGFNRKSLSDAAGLNETAVRDIMNGRARRPLYTTIIALADVLGCTPGDLVDGWRASERDELRQALARADRIIGWMWLYAGKNEPSIIKADLDTHRTTMQERYPEIRSKEVDDVAKAAGAAYLRAAALRF